MKDYPCGGTNALIKRIIRLGFKASLVVFVAFSLPLLANGKAITRSQASDVAINFLQGKVPGYNFVSHDFDSDDSFTVRVAAATVGDDIQSDYYIFNNDNGDGFVIVSGDDAMKPIVGYSLSGRFDYDNMPVQLAEYLKDYQSNVASVKAGYAVAGRSAGGDAVAPLILTKWDQSNPYNDLCKNEYATYYTGCVATAMAQVMKYHNFPPNGHGVINSGWLGDEDFDLSQSTYDWSNMRNEYSSSNWTEAEAAAVALLMRDAGCAVEMIYGTNYSSAFNGYIAPAMYKYFNYSKDIRHLYRDAYDTQEWMNIIRENLLRGEPILYSASGAEGGHSFVCDGIDENDYVHINWGWSGLCDGYFDINALAPIAVGIGGFGGNYYKDHNMVVNIRPGDPDVDNSDYIAPLEAWKLRASTPSGVDNDGRLLGNSPLEFDLLFMVSNNSNNKILGSSTLVWMAALYDSNKNLIDREFSRVGERYMHSANTYWESSVNLKFNDIADGDYYVSLWYKYDADDREFDFASDPYFPVTVKNGALYLKSQVDTPDPIEIMAVDQASVIYENMNAGKLSVTVRNNGKSQIAGEAVSVYYLPEAEAVDNPDPATLKNKSQFYLNPIYAGATATYTATIPCRDYEFVPGRYRLYFSFRDKLIVTDENYYMEISQMPSDCPFVLLDQLKTNSTTYENSDHEWMELTFTYASVSGWEWWFDTSLSFRVLAEPVDKSTPEFVMFESNDVMLKYSATDNSRTLSGSPAVLWKTPGEYRIWLSYKHELDDDWTVIDDSNNSAVVTLVEEVPFTAVNMVGPMIINGGKNVKPDSQFDVTMRIKSPTGINIDADSSYPVVTSDLQSWNSIAFVRSLEFGKTELAPGEETDVRINFYISDVEEYYGNRYMVLLHIYYDKYYSVLPRPGEYIESLYFTVDDPSGIDNVKCDSVYGCKATGHTIFVDGIVAGEIVEVWSADGVKVAEREACGSRCEISLPLCRKGMYIVNVRSDSNNRVPTKVVLR